MNEKEMEKEFEWISVSDVAKRENVTVQTIYNRIRDNLYETMEFQRGKLRGVLVKYVIQ